MTAVEFIEPLSHDEGVKNATDLFRATYGEEPAGVWAAPGRVNLIGEHTDYNAGLCLPIALPHRTFIALKPREDTKVRVVSDVDSENVTEADLDGLQAGGVEGWAATGRRCLGIARSRLRCGAGLRRGILLLRSARIRSELLRSYDLLHRLGAG